MRVSDWSSDVCSSDLVPHPFDRFCVAPARRDLDGARQMPEHGKVDRLGRRAQRRMRRHLSQITDQPVERGEARQRVAPEEAGERRKAMLLDRHDFLRRHAALRLADRPEARSEEKTSELQSLMRISSAVFCLKHKKNT